MESLKLIDTSNEEGRNSIFSFLFYCKQGRIFRYLRNFEYKLLAGNENSSNLRYVLIKTIYFPRKRLQLRHYSF